jgi:YVTN family beta-propeller protein
VVGRGIFAVLAVAVGGLACSGGAAARDAFVANVGSGTVSVVDTGTSSVRAEVAVGREPVDVAIAPDGARAYVVDKGSNQVSVIDTATGSVVATVAVGREPDGIAISPGGRYAYVSNFGDGTVSRLDLATDSVAGGPIAVGEEPEGVAISPDSRFAYVALRSGGVAAIDTGSDADAGPIAGDDLPGSRLAIVPGGGRAFVTDPESTAVTAFDPATRDVVGPPIGVGGDPAGIAIGPNGTTAYAALPLRGAITPIDTTLDAPLSGPIGGFPGATGVAIAPNGLGGYVSDGSGSSVTVLDATRNAAVGSSGVGARPAGVAVVPDQGPIASFWVSPDRRRAKQRLAFHAAASLDPDGQIVDYAWEFGDGGRVEGTAETRIHRYRKPGRYFATLTVTDGEGCSAERVFTGQTVSCNGSPAAVYTVPIVVAANRGPALKLRGGRRQPVGGQVKVFSRCPREACSVRVNGALVTVVERGGEEARRNLRLPGSRALRLTRGWRRLRVKLPRGRRRLARRSIRQGGEAKVVVSAIAADPTGQVRTLKRRKVKLTLPR